MKKHWIAAGTAVSAVVAGVAFTGGPAQAATPACTTSAAALYQAPASVPATPGQVLGCRTATLTGVVGAPKDFSAWQTQYATQDATGRPQAAVATVLVPKAAWKGKGTRPVVAFTPGTVGIGTQCALSKGLTATNQTSLLGAGIGDLLQAGFAVAAADGIGYLDGQVHPYVMGGSSGRALLDATRAAFQLPGTGLDKNTQVGISGYSEGGHTALWAAQLASSYAPELKVVGAAAGGVPGDLKVVAGSLDGGPFAGFMAAAVIGAKETYPNLPFDELLNDAGKAAIAKAKTSCTLDLLASFAFNTLGSYTKANYTLPQMYLLKGSDGVTWGERVDEQKVGVGVGTTSSAKYRITFPVFQYRGFVDEIIDVKAQEWGRTSYCKAGIATKWQQYPGDHITTSPQASQDVTKWLGDRFAGKAEKGNCPLF